MSSQSSPSDPRAGLARAAAALARGASVDAILSAVLDAAAAALGARSGRVYLQDPDRPELRLAASSGATAADAALQADDPVAEAARRRTPTYDRPLGGSPPGRAADLPLVVSRDGVDLPLGAVSFEWDAPAADPAEAEAAAAFADLLAIAVDRGRLASLASERAEWFERMAHTDPLTGLANERTFGRVLELEVARASRQGSEVSVAIFDVDDFAAVNDEAGREAGDDVLRAVASVVAESVRLVDTVARYGADEFVVVAPGSAGGTVARRILDGVAKLSPVGGRDVSVSAGVARFPDDATSAEALVEAAERALEAAKSAGPGRLSPTPHG